MSCSWSCNESVEKLRKNTGHLTLRLPLCPIATIHTANNCSLPKPHFLSKSLSIGLWSKDTLMKCYYTSMGRGLSRERNKIFTRCSGQDEIQQKAGIKEINPCGYLPLWKVGCQLGGVQFTCTLGGPAATSVLPQLLSRGFLKKGPLRTQCCQLNFINGSGQTGTSAHDAMSLQVLAPKLLVENCFSLIFFFLFLFSLPSPLS